jgi:hypothetical protein
MFALAACAGVVAMAAPSRQASPRDAAIQGGDAPQGEAYDNELLGSPAGNRPVPSAKSPAAGGDKASELSDRLKRELGSAAESEDLEKNPLDDIAREMGEARDLIGKHDAGPGTQHLQRQIVADLDKLIEEAKKAAGQNQSGANPKDAGHRRPTGEPDKNPKTTSGKSGGTNPHEAPSQESSEDARHHQGKGQDAAQVRSMMEKVWGELPKKEREQMQELPAEEFLPKYRPQIETYFRRLSEGKNQRRDVP